MAIRAVVMAVPAAVAPIRMLTLLPVEAMEAMGREAAQEPDKEQPPASSERQKANCTLAAEAVVLLIPHTPMAVLEAAVAVVPIKGIIRNPLPASLIQVAAVAAAFLVLPLAYMALPAGLASCV